MANDMDRLKNMEINDDDLENISGGFFSDGEYAKAAKDLACVKGGLTKRGAMDSMLFWGNAKDMFCEMRADKDHSYTAADYRKALKDKFGIEFN